MTSRSIVISTNSAWNIFNFRRDLIACLQQRGFRITALAPDDGYGDHLRALGIDFIVLPIARSGLSPLGDLKLLKRYHTALGRIRPDLFLGYTIKPNIYGSIAAQMRGIPVINNVSGLGTAFIRPGPLRRIVTTLYRRAFRKSATVFFQNADDRSLFLEDRIVSERQARLVPGSGIDVAGFTPPEREDRSGISFILVGRLLWDKGLREYIEAARMVRAQRRDSSFRLLGFLDPENRTAVTAAELDAWVSEGVVEYLGTTDDVRPHLAAADCVVLPSYREGLPRSLLEGAAMAMPLIATDVPGCRDVVDEGSNGYLCKVQDAASLAEAMLRMADLPPDERAEMGRRGRRKIEQEFDKSIVIDRYLQAIESALSAQRR